MSKSPAVQRTRLRSEVDVSVRDNNDSNAAKLRFANAMKNRGEVVITISASVAVASGVYQRLPGQTASFRMKNTAEALIVLARLEAWCKTEKAHIESEEEKLSEKIRVEGGKMYAPKDSDTVDCELHNFHTTWGKLGPIERLVLTEGLDSTNGRCLLDSGGN